ncbi:hypothetical protein F5888DRAFT_1803176 [Russula emetica]|nr:hypothetical protein F5888DRAFT_1803176 [Russula emetica]
MAYAAPVAPRGAILNRQGCMAISCRDATSPPAPPAASGSTDRITVMSDIIAQLLALMGTKNNTPSNASTTTVVTASSSSAAPASDPTGTPQSVPTISGLPRLPSLLTLLQVFNSLVA